jgi:hypothetical protein
VYTTAFWRTIYDISQAADRKEHVMRVTRVLEELVAYLRFGGGTDGGGGYDGGGQGDRVIINLVVCILEHYVGKGTTEWTEGNGRDTTFWEMTEGALPGSGTGESARGSS